MSAAVLPRRAVVPSPVLATALLVFTEVMLFAALVSAYIVLRGRADTWPPVGQPRLPVALTAGNTALLLLSGVTMARALSAHVAAHTRNALLQATLLLGGAFLLLQGVEWAALVHHGATAATGMHAATFATLVGCHALHVVAALVALALVLRRARQGRLGEGTLRAMRMYWTFVVAVWPPLYALVYLW